MKHPHRNPGWTRRLAVLLAAALLSACATIQAPPPEERIAADPWEPFNRNMYAFNRGVDRAVLQPLARGYNTITPEPVERGIANALDNLRSVPVMLNLLLQGRPAHAGRMFERFFVNSVFGLGGILDVASDAGIPDFDEDFGQTLAVWGWEDSRFLVLPFLGPSTLRDALSRPVDATADVPWREVIDGRLYILGVDIVQQRADLLDREEDLEAAFDEYLLVRDAWLQQRAYKISGESTTPDYDVLLEEDPWDDDLPPTADPDGD
ncbi:MlaA family lipoprotein [Halomonas denitrificans]|nr:VacJ family lipoprotein [Halomonas denitrificans]